MGIAEPDLLNVEECGIASRVLNSCREIAIGYSIKGINNTMGLPWFIYDEKVELQK